MMSNGRLGDYLRARRERLQPHDVGLAVGAGQRKVPGLRREEVAILAGISTDYYLRLEQGRDVRPSAQVVDALARALRLDAVATAHLRGLARPDVPPSAVAAPDRGDLVHDSIRWMIDSWPMTAALVHSRYLDVLASNPLARALNRNYRAGVNSVLTLLTDPAEREFHVGWEGLAARSVALLRSIADTHRIDERLDSLIAEGTAGSALFGELWRRQDVHRPSDGVHDLRHPQVGPLALHFVRLPLPATDGQSIFAYSAEPRTSSAAALRRLSERADVGGTDRDTLRSLSQV